MVDWHLSLAIKPLQTNIWSFPITWQTQSGRTFYVAAGFSQSKCSNSQKVEAASLKAFAQKTGSHFCHILHSKAVIKPILIQRQRGM